MMRLGLSNLRITQKGLLVVLIPLFFEAAFVIVLILLLNQTDAQIQRQEESRKMLAAGHELARVLVNATTAAAATQVNPAEDRGRKRLTKWWSAVGSQVERMRDLAQAENAGEQSLISEISNSFDQVQPLLANPPGGTRTDMNLISLLSDPWLLQVMAPVKKIGILDQRLMLYEEDAARKSLESVHQSQRAIEVALITGAVFSLLLTIWLTLYFSRSIAQRIHALSQNAISLGRREPLANRVEGNDEIKQLDAALRRTDETLTALEQARQELIAFVSHELKTPLASMQIVFTLLGEDAFEKLEPAKTKLAQEATGSLEELNNLITDLIDVERMEGGKFRLALAETDVGTLIDSAVNKIRLSNSTADIIVTESSHTMVMADERRLDRVITNLLRSAQRRATTGATIEIESRILDDELRIIVSDSGAPPGEDLKRILCGQDMVSDNAEDLNTYVTEVLPLITSKLIMEQHGGSFELTSAAPGKTTFICMLPLNPVTAWTE